MLFADFHQEQLRYVPERKSWVYYENEIWSQDIGGLKAMNFCMSLANLLHMYALKIEDEQEKVVNTNSFLNLVKKCTDITELDAEIIRTFIERVYIYNVENIQGKR